jgi:hypothetical protein
MVGHGGMRACAALRNGGAERSIRGPICGDASAAPQAASAARHRPRLLSFQIRLCPDRVALPGSLLGGHVATSLPSAASHSPLPQHPHFCRTSSAFLRNYLRIPAEPVPSSLFISYPSLLLSIEIGGAGLCPPQPQRHPCSEWPSAAGSSSGEQRLSLARLAISSILLG